MLSLALLMTGCATPIRVIDSFCAVYEPIHYSRLHDTPETIAQVKRNNAAYDRICHK